MNCPRCKAELKTEQHKGIEVDRCPDCEGMWLDYPELDQLEDIVLDEDKVKGTMIFSSRTSYISCPRCGGLMKAFRYRLYDLELDFCERLHGFWLDQGEEKRVLELMDRRIKDLKRSTRAEAEWADFLRRAKSKSFVDRLKGLFRT